MGSQRAAIAEDTALQKLAEASVVSANAARDKIRLEARTREAALAQANAANAQSQTEALKRQSEAAQQQSAAMAKEARDAQSRSAQLEAQLKDLNAKQTKRGMVVTIGDVLFDTNRAELKAGALRSVDQLAAFFRDNPKRNALIEGFTDSMGSDSANQVLSELRALAVRDALVERGIDGRRVAVQGFGEAYPVASNDIPGGRQLNRRVEIILSDDSGVIAAR